MSDEVIKIIPADPRFIPDEEAIQKAQMAFLKIIQNADEIKVSIQENVIFVDQGENFERVLCPFCGCDCSEWWNEEMERASENNFLELEVMISCCKKNTTLNDLKYEWPAGFGRFIMEAINPQWDNIHETGKKALEKILGCDLKIIKARY